MAAALLRPGERPGAFTDHCGCCGRPMRGSRQNVELWCVECDKHVLHPANPGFALHERTYFAQHGEDCPYSVTIEEA